jgi:hypothetical protein
MVGAIAGLTHTWQGPVEVEDLRAACCKCHGVPVRDERPCFWLYNVLSDAECEALMDATLEHHESPLSPDDYQKDPGCRSQFTSNDSELSALLWQRIRESVPESLDSGTACGLMPRIAHCRYFPGQVGFPHMDFRHSLGTDKCVASRISFTMYLNDDYEGGDLGFIGELRMDGTHGGEHRRVHPRKGSAVLFYQGVQEFAHLPHEITSGCKSIMRADVLYRFEDEAAADVGCLHLN